MKFKIRFADQIVGILIIIAIVSLIFVIFMLGRAQRWFSRDHSYESFAVSASGINKNMGVTCRGIVIGNVKDFFLIEDNRVKVIFTIQDEFHDRAREGSIVEVVVSPIGLGGSFVFYPGLGGPLEEGALVPMRDSAEAREYIALGLANIPAHDDPIADILEKVNGIVDELNQMVGGLNVGPNGKAATALGQTIVNIEHFTGDLADSNTIPALEASLISLSGILDNLEKSTAYIPREMPQIFNLVSQARTAVQAANDVLISLKNNPLLRRGIPEHAEIDASGTNPRNIRF